jgi:hypothetical protein
LRGRKRCAVHDREFRTVEAKKAFLAGAAAWRARQASRIARGKAKRFPQGRKKKWIIARPWRFTSLSQADEAIVVRQRLDALMRGAGHGCPPWQSHASASMEAQACESLERTFIAKLNDRSAGLSLEQVERTYETIIAAELAIGGEGCEIRKRRLAWERQQWILRASLPAVVEQVAVARQEAAERDRPPGAASLHGEMRLENQKTGQNNQAAGDQSPPLPASVFEPATDPVETAAERRERRLQAAYEFSMAIVAAGQATGRRQRELEDAATARVPRSASERVHPVHTIAPWLYER